MINKKQVEELVSIFYQPTFKVFYINADHEYNMVKPSGVFVSLGLTSTVTTIESVRKSLEGLGKGYVTSFAILATKRNNNNFLNRIEKCMELEDVEQFRLATIPDEVMERDDAVKRLEELRAELSDQTDITNIAGTATKVHKLESLIEKIDRELSWDRYGIIPDPTTNSYMFFHKFVNYMKKDDIEYRIGIYVTNAN